MVQTPTNVDLPNPQKLAGLVYDPQVLLGTISSGGSVSSSFDLSSWTQFALQVVPTGTILGGTVWNIWGATSLQDSFYPLAGTSGAAAQSIQVGSTGNLIYGPISIMQPIRFIQFVAGGTQSSAQTLRLLVK